MSTYTYTDEFTPVSSSVIKNVKYDKDSSDLFITTNGDAIYRYKNVPEVVFKRFLVPGTSAGSVYSNRVRGVYSATRVSNYSTWKKTSSSYGFQTASPAGKASFEVVVKVDGTLTIKGEADNVSDALAKAQDVLSDTFEGNYKVLELKQKFA